MSLPDDVWSIIIPQIGSADFILLHVSKETRRCVIKYGLSAWNHEQMIWSCLRNGRYREFHALLAVSHHPLPTCLPEEEEEELVMYETEATVQLLKSAIAHLVGFSFLEAANGARRVDLVRLILKHYKLAPQEVLRLSFLATLCDDRIHNAFLESPNSMIHYTGSVPRVRRYLALLPSTLAGEGGRHALKGLDGPSLYLLRRQIYEKLTAHQICALFGEGNVWEKVAYIKEKYPRELGEIASSFVLEWEAGWPAWRDFLVAAPTALLSGLLGALEKGLTPQVPSCGVPHILPHLTPELRNRLMVSLLAASRGNMFELLEVKVPFSKKDVEKIVTGAIAAGSLDALNALYRDERFYAHMDVLYKHSVPTVDLTCRLASVFADDEKEFKRLICSGVKKWDEEELSCIVEIVVPMRSKWVFECREYREGKPKDAVLRFLERTENDVLLEEFLRH